jgi:hypothetical protein
VTHRRIGPIYSVCAQRRLNRLGLWSGRLAGTLVAELGFTSRLLRFCGEKWVRCLPPSAARSRRRLRRAPWAVCTPDNAGTRVL